MKRFLFILAGLVFLGLAGYALYAVPEGSGQNVLLRVSDRKSISVQEALSDLTSARLILVGELHGEKRHHEIQLEIIQALERKGVPLAIGMEMFRQDSQKTLDQWVNGASNDTEFIKVYYDNWSAPWPLYGDILLYARERRIPVVGLNVPREITKQVAEGGFSSLSGEQRKHLPPVTCSVDEQYRKFIERALSVHGHNDMDFTRFCEAQLVWDTAMAWNALQYLEANPERTVVILAGSGHAWKPGIPKQVEGLSRLAYRVILPEIPGKAEKETVTIRDADYLWLE